MATDSATRDTPDRVSSAVWTVPDECTECGSDQLYRDLIHDPPGVVHCEDCGVQISLPDRRSLETKARDELTHGPAFFVLGCIGIWLFRDVSLSDSALQLTLATVAGCFVLGGFIRSVMGVAAAAELTALGAYSVPVGESSVSLADSVTLAIAAAVPGLWLWYARPLGPLEAYLRGLALLLTVGGLLVVLTALLPDDDIVRPE